MATFILLSGFEKDGFFDTVTKELVNEIFDTKNLLFVPSNPSEYKKVDEYTKRINQYFYKIGICFDEYSILDKRMSNNEQVNAILRASCIFLMGGQTRVQLDYLKKQNLIELLHEYEGVVIGLSAGAINMAKRSVIANPYYPPVSTHEGMGLIDITITPHFNIEQSDFIETKILPLTYDGMIYGMCDNAVIIIRNEYKKHGGTIYELKQGSMRVLTSSDQI